MPESLSINDLLSLSEQSPCGIVVCDPHADEIFYANPAAMDVARITGLLPAAGRDISFPVRAGLFGGVLREKRIIHPDLPAEYTVAAHPSDWKGAPAVTYYISPALPSESGTPRTSLINAVPVGVGVCSMVNDFPLLHYYSDGLCTLSGRTRDQYARAVAGDPMALVHESDRARLIAALTSALHTGENANISYRVRHADGSFVWIHLSGRPAGGSNMLFLSFNVSSPEARLFQTIADHMSDAIYVIDKSNFDLLYVSESENFSRGCGGTKCYQVIHGLDKPCEGCRIRSDSPDGELCRCEFSQNGRFYTNDVCDTDWNGIPACVKYVRDVTDAVNARREKENLDRYYRDILKNLPGGAAVLARTSDGRYIPEYFSDALAEMLGMDIPTVWSHRDDITQGIHPADFGPLAQKVRRHIARGDERFDAAFRLACADRNYLWMDARISVTYPTADTARFYISFTDITHEVEERDRLVRKYNEMLLEHYRSPAPDALVIGHGNLTKNRMIEVIDRTGGKLMPFRDCTRDQFYDALCEWIVDPDERERFRSGFLTENLVSAYRRGETSHQFDLFMRFPGDSAGRYARISVHLTAMPDAGDIVGILTITDVTEKTVTRSMQQRLADAGCETLMDVDLLNDRYAYRRFRGESVAEPVFRDDYNASRLAFARNYVTPRDRSLFIEKTDPDYILDCLRSNEPLSFAYTLHSATGEIRVKRLTVFESDRRLRRVCIVMTDITQSVQEQQGLLNVMAYTFEMMGVIDLSRRCLSVHTRKTILNYQPPLFFPTLEQARELYTDAFIQDAPMLSESPFRLETLLGKLQEQPGGYEFIVSSHNGERPCYKQVNVLWGDENHSTICVVRADVTGMMLAEQETKKHLTDALKLARAANAAKSEFLSSVSHDIRTPMNAIIGMTDLALSSIDNPAQVRESLTTIRHASDHLLKLINNILDMSRIESGRMTLTANPFSHAAEMQAIVARTQILAARKNLAFTHNISVQHDSCTGDALRIHQILDNLLGNAVKFTPEGGKISLQVNELPPKTDQTGLFRYIVEDTGVGLSEDEIRHIFDPFFRTERSRSSHIEGSGLGMPIVKNLVDFMGGVIRIDSRENAGTKITVEIPILFAENEIASEQKDEGRREKFDLHGMHVLLVEDHPVNQLVARRMLENMNARVTIAQDGRQGAEMFEKSAENEFDAICMDIRMPVMDGYEAARYIRSCNHPKAQRIPILAMTANAFPDDVRKCHDAGMNDHLSKPINQTDLYEKLHST